MRIIHLYLAGYFLLVIGAGLALWQAGILRHVSAMWVGLAALVAFSLGLLLALTSAAPRRVTPD